MRSATTNSAREQILEHVEVDRAAAAVGVGAVRHQTGSRDCRRKEVLVNGVEVDRGPIRRFLLAKRRDDESHGGWNSSSACLPAGPNARTEASAAYEPSPIRPPSDYSLATWLGGLGFEPRLAESESAVLPLDDPPSDLGSESGPIAR